METNLKQSLLEDYDDIQQLYRFVKDGYDLAAWINFRLKNDEDFYDEYVIDDFDENYVEGHLMDYMFRVDFCNHCRIILKVEDDEDTEELLNVLHNIITPVVWHIGRKNKGKQVFRSKVLDYSTEGEIPTRAYAWDVDDPEGLINDVVKSHIDGVINIKRIECYYDNINLDDVFDSFNFGIYYGCIDDAYAKHLQTCSEFELFFNIRALNNMITEINSQLEYGQELNNVQYMYVKNTTYLFEFLKQQTRRFGVKAGSPSKTVNKPNMEFIMWYEWWNNAFNELLEENPNILNDWENIEHGFDISFRPKISFKEFEEEYKKQFAAQEKEKIKIVKENLSQKDKEVRAKRKQRSKTLVGRTQNVLESLQEHIHKEAGKNGNNSHSPFDYI